jgi:translation initiation factor 2 subunit 2
MEEIYNLNYLIDRFYNKNVNNNIKKSNIKRPIIQNLGKKTHIINFNQVCESINRDKNYISALLTDELKTQVSLSGKNILIINGKYRVNQIEKIFKYIIINFIRCKSCKSIDTTINKENRLMKIICNHCSSITSI